MLEDEGCSIRAPVPPTCPRGRLGLWRCHGAQPARHAVSLDFVEAYLDPESAFARYRRAMLWNPQRPGATENAARFLTPLKKGPGPDGGPFRYYSPNSDLLGIIVERASGMRYADLFREQLWMPLRARADAGDRR